MDVYDTTAAAHSVSDDDRISQCDEIITRKGLECLNALMKKKKSPKHLVAIHRNRNRLVFV